jgi:preprotein translocase subunit SecG
MSVLIGIFSVVLIFVSLALIFLVLMQKAKSDGGVAAMGGGVAESTFGAETGNVLSKSTINAAIMFFVLSFCLYLANVYQSKHRDNAADKLPTVVAPVSVSKPAAPVTAPVAAPVASTAAQPATPPPSAPKKP